MQGNGVAHAKCRGGRIETLASSEVGWSEAKIASGAGSQPLWRRSRIDAPFIHSQPNLRPTIDRLRATASGVKGRSWRARLRQVERIKIPSQTAFAILHTESSIGAARV